MVESSTHLPFALQLPKGWHAVDPAEGGPARTAFAAVRADSLGESFTPNVAVVFDTLDRTPDFAALAEAAVSRLVAVAAEVTVLDRTPVEDWGHGGVAQVLQLHLAGENHDTVGLDLVQSQVLLGVPLGEASLVVELSCTSTPGQAAAVAPEFSALVASLRVRDPITRRPDHPTTRSPDDPITYDDARRRGGGSDRHDG